MKSVVPPQAGVDVDQVQIRRAALFKRMLAKPDDLDTAFEYAALSVQVGDLEAGVSTLERMLVFAPGLPRLQLELGVLYYRLSAYETARTYFEAAVSGPDVLAEVRQRVDQYIASIDNAGETTRFGGQVRAGIRYQTNANRSPSNGTVMLNGIPFLLDPDAKGSPDGNVYGAGAFHFSTALPTQGDSLEADLVTYGTAQFDRHELNLALAELTVGPAFDLGRFNMETSALGVYGIASTVFVDGHFYSVGYGAGTRLVTRPLPGFSWTNALEYRYRDYSVSSIAPIADTRDGSEVRFYSAASYALGPSMVLSGNGYVQHDDARRDYLTYTETGLTVSLAMSFDTPIGALPWVVSPNTGFVYRKYDGPDRVINVSEAEHDTEVFVGADLTIPFEGNWALLTETEFRQSQSNYTTRDFDNFSVSVSFVKGF